MAQLRKSEAKMMVEEYLGYKKHYGKWISEGADDNGNPKGHWEHEEFVEGLIRQKLKQAEKLKEQANLGERFATRTFASFDAKRDKTAFEACSRYARDENIFQKKRNSLIIAGSYGNGKTHLAAAVSNALIDRGIPVMFGTFSEHLERLREEFDHTGERKYLSQMKVTPMLVLDDLGKERRTDWTHQILFDVVNYRYEHLLPMIVTTNLAGTNSVDALANHVGGAVWSRLCEMSGMIITSGKDYRQE